jgi:hypothetical protein
MGMLNLWREARGRVLRDRWDGLTQHFERVDDRARAACLDYIKSRFDPLNTSYSVSSSAERKRISLQEAKVSQQLAGSGDWPSALGLRIMIMNLTVRDLPGRDAFFVKLASDALIHESLGLSSRVTPLRRGRGRNAKQISSPLEKELNEALAASRPARN